MKASELLIRTGIADSSKEAKFLLKKKRVFLNDLILLNMNDDVNPEVGDSIKINNLIVSINNKNLK